MIEVIEIRLRESGKRMYYNPRGLSLSLRDQVIVEVERGMDHGTVCSTIQVKPEAEISLPLKSIIRTISESDQEKITENKYKAKEALYVCRSKIREHQLSMKLVKNEYAFDLSQLFFYFTAEGRVDFRSLVKDLAATFKTRIELRQVGARDETKMFGGIGPCGRGLCCSTFLKEFQPVTIKMAREQNLSLNPSKISGVCGRLMCCLAYENETYKSIRKELPKIGTLLDFGSIKAKVVDLNLLKKQVLISYHDDNAPNGRQIEWIDFSSTPLPSPFRKKIEVEETV